MREGDRQGREALQDCQGIERGRGGITTLATAHRSADLRQTLAKFSDSGAPHVAKPFPRRPCTIVRPRAHTLCRKSTMVVGWPVSRPTDIVAKAENRVSSPDGRSAAPILWGFAFFVAHGCVNHLEFVLGREVLALVGNHTDYRPPGALLSLIHQEL